MSTVDEVYGVLECLKSNPAIEIRPSRGVIDYIRESPKANSYRSLHVITAHDVMPYRYRGLACETPDSLGDIRDELVLLEKDLGILARLRACSSSVSIINSYYNYVGAKYCILYIDYEQQLTQIDVFPASQEKKAQERFNTLERKKEQMQDVLMVLVSSVKDLEAAYPNYSSDISYFLGIMDNLAN